VPGSLDDSQGSPDGSGPEACLKRCYPHER
jgi:hypothetical protein